MAGLPSLDTALAVAICCVWPNDKLVSVLKRTAALALISSRPQGAQPKNSNALHSYVMQYADLETIVNEAESKLQHAARSAGFTILAPEEYRGFLNLLKFGQFFSIEKLSSAIPGSQFTRVAQVVRLQAVPLLLAAANFLTPQQKAIITTRVQIALDPAHPSVPSVAAALCLSTRTEAKQTPEGPFHVLAVGQAVAAQLAPDTPQLVAGSSGANGRSWSCSQALQGGELGQGLPEDEKGILELFSLYMAVCSMVPCTCPKQAVRLAVVLALLSSPEEIVRINGGRHKGLLSFAERTVGWTVKRITGNGVPMTALLTCSQDLATDPLLIVKNGMVIIKLRQMAALCCTMYDNMVAAPPRSQPSTKSGLWDGSGYHPLLVFPPTFLHLDHHLLHYQSQPAMLALMRLWLSDQHRPHLVAAVVRELRVMAAQTDPDSLAPFAAACAAKLPRQTVAVSWLPPNLATPLRSQTLALTAIAAKVAREQHSLVNAKEPKPETSSNTSAVTQGRAGVPSGTTGGRESPAAAAAAVGSKTVGSSNAGAEVQTAPLPAPWVTTLDRYHQLLQRAGIHHSESDARDEEEEADDDDDDDDDDGDGDYYDGEDNGSGEAGKAMQSALAAVQPAAHSDASPPPTNGSGTVTPLSHPSLPNPSPSRTPAAVIPPAPPAPPSTQGLLTVKQATPLGAQGQQQPGLRAQLGQGVPVEPAAAAAAGRRGPEGQAGSAAVGPGVQVGGGPQVVHAVAVQQGGQLGDAGGVAGQLGRQGGQAGGQGGEVGVQDQTGKHPYLVQFVQQQQLQQQQLAMTWQQQQQQQQSLTWQQQQQLLPWQLEEQLQQQQHHHQPLTWQQQQQLLSWQQEQVSRGEVAAWQQHQQQVPLRQGQRSPQQHPHQQQMLYQKQQQQQQHHAVDLQQLERMQLSRHPLSPHFTGSPQFSQAASQRHPHPHQQRPGPGPLPQQQQNDMQHVLRHMQAKRMSNGGQQQQQQRPQHAPQHGPQGAPSEGVVSRSPPRQQAPVVEAGNDEEELLSLLLG